MSIVRTPETAPLKTFVRTDSPLFNETFLDFLPSPSEKMQIFENEPSWDAPDVFEGRRVWKGYLSPVKNQADCGGCYAFASTSALADCFNLRSAGKLHLDLSPARVILCDVLGDYSSVLNVERHDRLVKNVYQRYGCQGNTLMEAWSFLYNYGTNTEACFPALPDKTCRDITGFNFDECADGTPAVFYRAQHIYAVAGTPADGGSEYSIRKIIYKFGPVSTAMTIYEDFYTFDPRHVYIRNPSARRLLGHAVVIDGWGEENGIKYWWVRNSWGPKWGLGGYFKILRGSNHCEIEGNVIAGIPDIVRSISPYFEQSLFQDNTFNPANKRAIMSPYTSYGGIDRRTGISRRLLSYATNQDWPAKPVVDSDPSFFVGQLRARHTRSWTILVFILLIGLGLLLFHAHKQNNKEN